MPSLLSAAFDQIDKMIAYLLVQRGVSRQTKENPGKLHEHPKGLSVCKTAAELIQMLEGKVIKLMGVYIGQNNEVFLKLMKVVNYIY